MLYTKPAHKSYVALAMEFDKEFYSGHRDDNKLYSYMYLLYYMLACKKQYFHLFEDYDAYSQFAATTIYMRFLKKEKQGEKIKSVLNYCKSTLYSLKVMYQNDTFNEVWSEDKTDAEAMKTEMASHVQADYNEDLKVALVENFKTLPAIIWKTIRQTPYKNDDLMCRKLYLSCMLSLINSLNISKKTKDKMSSPSKDSDAVLMKSLAKQREESMILWHLDDSMEDYVKTLINKVKVIFSKQLEDTKNSYILEDDVLDAILNSVYDDYDTEETPLNSEEGY
jgi:hypothetical protein